MCENSFLIRNCYRFSCQLIIKLFTEEVFSRIKRLVLSASCRLVSRTLFHSDNELCAERSQTKWKFIRQHLSSQCGIMQPDAEAFFCGYSVCCWASDETLFRLSVADESFVFNVYDFPLLFSSSIRSRAHRKIEIKRKTSWANKRSFFWCLFSVDLRQSDEKEILCMSTTTECEVHKLGSQHGMTGDCWIFHEITLKCHEIGRRWGTGKSVRKRSTKKAKWNKFRGDQSVINNGFSFVEFIPRVRKAADVGIDNGCLTCRPR